MSYISSWLDKPILVTLTLIIYANLFLTVHNKPWICVHSLLLMINVHRHILIKHLHHTFVIILTINNKSEDRSSENLNSIIFRFKIVVWYIFVIFSDVHLCYNGWLADWILSSEHLFVFVRMCECTEFACLRVRVCVVNK